MNNTLGTTGLLSRVMKNLSGMMGEIIAGTLFYTNAASLYVYKYVYKKRKK